MCTDIIIKYQVIVCDVSLVYPVVLMNSRPEMMDVFYYLMIVKAKQTATCALQKYQDEELWHLPTTQESRCECVVFKHYLFNREHKASQPKHVEQDHKSICSHEAVNTHMRRNCRMSFLRMLRSMLLRMPKQKTPHSLFSNSTWQRPTYRTLY